VPLLRDGMRAMFFIFLTLDIFIFCRYLRKDAADAVYLLQRG
jgi:hypothetical protein